MTFRYADNGRLEIAVKVADSDKQLQHEITRENSLSVEQLDSWRQYILGAAGHPLPVDAGK